MKITIDQMCNDDPWIKSHIAIAKHAKAKLKNKEWNDRADFFYKYLKPRIQDSVGFFRRKDGPEYLFSCAAYDCLYDKIIDILEV